METDVLADFCDGTYYKNHGLFSVHRNALQIMMYYDDVEVCNPLGSHTKVHKLGKYLCSCRFSYVHVFTGLFYFLLGNCHPKYRSKLKAVQLVAICKHHSIKQYSLDAILHPFLQDLKKLVCCFYIHKHMFTIKISTSCMIVISLCNNSRCCMHCTCTHNRNQAICSL